MCFPAWSLERCWQYLCWSIKEANTHLTGGKISLGRNSYYQITEKVVCENSFSWKTGTYLSYKVNNVAADGMAAQGARPFIVNDNHILIRLCSAILSNLQFPHIADLRLNNTWVIVFLGNENSACPMSVSWKYIRIGTHTHAVSYL